MNDPRPTREGCARAAKILILLATIVAIHLAWALFHR